MEGRGEVDWRDGKNKHGKERDEKVWCGEIWRGGKRERERG